MTTLLTHAWKRVVDVVPFTFDFTQQLQAGETITLSTALVGVQVFAGYDPNPSDLLYGGAFVDLTNANAFIQSIQHGLDGVVYNLIASVQTSSNRLIFQTCKLAILLRGLPASGIIVPFYLTSRPYPLDQSESFQVSVILESGSLLYNPRWEEGLTVSTLPLSGVLVGALVTYANPPEGITVSALVLSGALNVGLILYTSPSENLQVSILPLSGNLQVGLVNYAIPGEGIVVSITPLSGVLA